MRIIFPICCLAGSDRLLESTQADGGVKALGDLIADADTPALFDWLMRMLSFQGVSDQAAATYMDTHGSPKWAKIASRLAARPTCPKLRSYWDFAGCGYSKWKATCSNPDHIECCPVPKDRLRNGRLNQTAFSLLLFLRDIADGDVVRWIDARLQTVNRRSSKHDLAAMREALLGPLRHVYGVADKVLSMALASLLLAAPLRRTVWRGVGGSMIAIDTLVHKLLHRTGILHHFDAEHPYGPACYQPNGCADIIDKVAGVIDARRFNRNYPRRFPRFVQHAIWRYCAQDGLAICNSVRISDRKRCGNVYCRVFKRCNRRPVKLR